MAKSVERVFRVASGISKSGNTISLASGVAGTGLTYTTGTLSIGSGAITSTMISDGTIVNADISASAAIALSKLATDPLARANHTGTQTLSTISDAGTAASKNIPATGNASVTEVVYGSDTRLTDSRSPSGSAGGDLAGTYPNPTIGTGKVTSTHILDGTIVNADINASAAIALSKLATDPLARANHTGTQTASTISDFDAQVRVSRLDQMAVPTASVSLNSQKITSLATPTASTDAATKGYVDGAVPSTSAFSTKAFSVFLA